MSNFTQARKAVVARILEGDGRAPHALRRAAFDNAALAEPLPAALIDKVARHAYKVTDEDIAAAKTSGLSEDQIFELVVCAAIGQATRQYDTALAALEAATEKERSEHAPSDPQ
jgi:alkylhydroperoxidase family enzyme